ncbi:hypothetical protein FZ103_12455 [Streptomonospora sp. PA3]|uniref:hypothetical protein n=1 Tax=Streptomonospora sp. PA3 TaxID=2607326 RepID=UPI0013098EA2|nr:hypothetical protein [Streptomonospora sp. PA3]MUL41976.1 hypothetical protein [Streptomonospora sp. PA3]
MATVSAEHVLQLLRSEEPSPVLVVHRGRAEVVAESALEESGYRGALRLAGRDELGIADEPEQVSREDAEELARRLNSAVEEMGG